MYQKTAEQPHHFNPHPTYIHFRTPLTEEFGVGFSDFIFPRKNCLNLTDVPPLKSFFSADDPLATARSS